MPEKELEKNGLRNVRSGTPRETASMMRNQWLDAAVNDVAVPLESAYPILGLHSSKLKNFDGSLRHLSSLRKLCAEVGWKAAHLSG